MEPPPNLTHSNAEFDLRQVPLDLALKGLLQLQLNILIAQVTEAPGKRAAWREPRGRDRSGRLRVLQESVFWFVRRTEDDRKLPPHSPGVVLVLVALLSLRGSCQNVTSPSFGGVKQVHRPSLPLLFPTVGRL